MILLAMGLSIATFEARATNYYVDPTSGNDANAGVSQTAAWKTIPGMRTADDSGFLQGAWGAISPSNPIKAGDSIEIKAGTAITKASGGRLQIDATYYQDGTSANPIVIRVSANWGDGTFLYDGNGIYIPRYYPLVAIDRRDYIQLRGANPNRRFVIKNAAGGGWGIMIDGSLYSSKKQVGIVLDYLELANNLYGGSSISYSDDWTISNSVSHDNGEIGFDTGALNDTNANNGMYSDDEAYRNGMTVDSSGIAHGFGLYGSTDITFLRCTSHDNGRDGFDFGTSTNTNSSSATVINSSSYGNGEDGFGANGGTEGTQKFNYVNTIAFNNGSSGWNIYDGAQVRIYHSIAHSNGEDPGFGGNIKTYTEEGFLPTIISLRNNIFYKPKKFAQIGSYRSLGGQPIVSSDNNLYIPRLSDSEVAFDIPWGTQPDYSAPPVFIGSSDRLGTSYDPGFVKGGDTSNFAANDYRLAGTMRSAINSGAPIASIAVEAKLSDALAKDRDGNIRNSPPDIGPYEFMGETANLPAPANIRISPK